MKCFLEKVAAATLFMLSLPACLDASPTPSSASLVSRQAARTPYRIRLYSANARNLSETDYDTWEVADGATSNAEIGSLSLSLSASEGATLTGGEYKEQARRFLSSLGERVVNQGVTTNEDDGAGASLTLSITGLEQGEHTLLTWHNTWDNVDSPSTIDVEVDGTSAATDVSQSTRVDNIWESASSYVRFEVDGPEQEVRVMYAPTADDGFVYLNGFEIDTAALPEQISFPTPHHRDERIDLGGGETVTATWRAPSGLESVTYNAYLGTARDDLASVAEGLTETSVELAGLDTLETYYWRVDVAEGGTTYAGRVFMFRAAQLAFPGAEGWG